MAGVLGVGIATLDIINVVDGYPREDEKVRAQNQRIARGGNCTNTLVVLSQLGHHCSWAGLLTNEPDARHIRLDLIRHNIDTTSVQTIPQGKIPTSYVVLNRLNGSRTVIHYRDLPEFSYQDFCKIDLHHYDWFHFEGRNVPDTALMLQCVRHIEKPHPSISLEIEIPRANIEELLPLADILFFSHSYARACGHQDSQLFLKKMRQLAPKAILVLAYGKEGAYALNQDNAAFHSPAFPPPQVLDTLGAGDTFNAGIIDALIKGMTLAEALEYANRLAGRKCGHIGLDFVAYD